MEYPPVVEQSHQHPRSFSFIHLATEFGEQCLDIRPTHIARYGATVDQTTVSLQTFSQTTHPIQLQPACEACRISLASPACRALIQ